MEEKENLGILTIEKDGEAVDCDVLFTFECEELGKTYVGYTDHAIAANGRKNIYVSSYDPIIGFDGLGDITTPEELDMVSNVLNSIAEAK